MVLTEEQKERIKRNRERALEIRRMKEKERQEAEAQAKIVQSKKEQGPQNHQSKGLSSSNERSSDGGTSTDQTKTSYQQRVTNVNVTTNTSNSHNQVAEEEEEDIELEDFEVNASKYVTKQEAMKIYCLPPGTLAICSFIEKDNPRQSKWSKMKLYERSEIRRRARERFGGLHGLVEERRKREMKRFERDFEDSNDVFCSNKKQKK